MKADRVIPALLLLLLCGAAFGMVKLFSWRFRSGDIFPSYSSYRADPIGTKILYTSLDELPGVTVRRQLEPLDVDEGEGMTWVLLGNSRFDEPHHAAETLLPFLRSGGRVIWAYEPVAPRLRELQTFEIELDDEPDEDTESEESDEEAGEGEALNDVEISVSDADETDRDMLRLGYTQWLEEEMEEPDAAHWNARSADSDDDGSLPWYSAAYFKPVQTNEWNVQYSMDGRPVVMERTVGRGSILVMTDSYLFSNEAMVVDRFTPLLTEWIGDAKTILFDEYHLGISSNESIMMLIYRYRLQGVVLAFILLAGLYIWQQASGFVPKYRDPVEGHNDVGSGIRSSDGLVNLLTRHVPAKQLPEAMVSEWKETFGRRPGAAQDEKKIEQALAELQRQDGKPNVTAWYNELVGQLEERKKYGRNT